MGLALRKPAVYSDLFDLPPNRIGQIVNGRVVALPRPASRHARVYSNLGFEIGTAFDRGRGGPGGWWIIDEPELHLGDDVLVPDLAGWRRERMPVYPDAPWFDLPPDWVCEILSPSNARLDRHEKLPIYAAYEVAHAWLIDPDLRTLEAFANVEGRWQLLQKLQGSADVAAAPFAAVSFPLASLWE